MKFSLHWAFFILHRGVEDIGLFIEVLAGTSAGSKISEMIFKNRFISSILINPLTCIDIYYLIRRKSMQERAKEELDKMKKLVRIVPLEEFAELVGEIKVMTSLSLADAANIALGEHKNVKVLFKHEHELDDQIAKQVDAPFRSRIVFIDDFPYYLGDTKKGELIR